MAKGNLFLGTATKKLGDVVMMRRDGEQVSRVRVRTIANPKSDGQAAQRNFLAPVAKFYAPLASCLERSWEGKNRTKSYQAFLKANINLARQNGWSAVKGAPFTPFPYKLSEGTLNAAVVSFQAGPSTFVLANTSGSNPSNWGGISAILINGYGLQEGDQVTFILVNTEGDGYSLRYERMFINTASSASIPSFIQYSGSVNISATAACAVIFSRYENEKWRRSTQYLVLNTATLAKVTGAANLAAAIKSYQKESSTPTSDVYLNGSTGSGSAGTVSLSTLGGADVIVEGIEINGTYYKAVDGNGNEYYMKCLNERSDAFDKVMSTSSTEGTTPPQDATNDNTLAVANSWSSAKSTEVALFMMNEGIPFATVANFVDWG